MSTRTAAPRLPIAPLIQRIGHLPREERWAKRDTISVILADRLACRLGTHPADVWGDEWWRASREEWERSSRWPVDPLLERGHRLVDVVVAAGRDRQSNRPVLSRADARKACAVLGHDPADVWPDWHWIGPA